VIDAGEAVILVRGPNWLGDTVMALPALRALRAGRPAARITLAGRWADGIDALLAQPGPPEQARIDGAEVAAHFLLHIPGG